MKATNLIVDQKFLDERHKKLLKYGYHKTKWMEFCEEMHSLGLKCSLYEARETRSKYITVIGKDRSIKVRFSNHRPIKFRELRGDCDFFVGVTNTGVRTTRDAIAFVKAEFKL